MRAVRLNIDLGELEGEPDALYALATQVNVACGGHAGDVASMRRACRLARASGANIAAHPSYPDRAGFGRTRMKMSEAALHASLLEQCQALREAARVEGATVSMVKAHGALYHDVDDDQALASVFVAASIEAFGDAPTITFVGAPLRRLAEVVARDDASSFVAEAFADRAYDGDRLRARGLPGALITDAESAANQALLLARSGRFGTLCVHGDTPGAVAIARRVRSALEAEGLLR